MADARFVEAANVFLALRLPYVFSYARVTGPECDDEGSTKEASHILRFTFSKPTPLNPCPQIAVDMYLELLEEQGNIARYLVRMEGQRFSRLISVDLTDIASQSFLSSWIDKVFEQKEAMMRKTLWA